jgi:SAM-dependent methyltransferase
VRVLLPLLAALAIQGGAVPIPYDEARPILDAHRKEIAAAGWPAWIARRDAEIRARLAAGDEDSLVNLWLYGTSFTKRPRATDAAIAKLRGTPQAEALLIARLDDLVAAIASPGRNERLEFARQLLARKGINVATAEGRDRASEFLVKARERVLAENERHRRDAQSADRHATLYRDRGLSSDTRLTAGFSVDAALAAIKAAGQGAGTIRRAAIVGPGLDFTDKAEGYDFYPQQTIQPFAVVDSLLRLGLANARGLRLATFDLSPRVNGHLDAAHRRARAGRPYILQLPLKHDEPGHDWSPDLVAYWKGFGARIGKETPATPAPAGTGAVRLRAVRVDSAIVLAIEPHDLNIIVQRPEPLRDEDRFDLIVATNILVYYDSFDQALALANIGKMLRPGGWFLTNYPVSPSGPMDATATLTVPVFFDRQGNGDTIYCYRRQ